MIAWLLLAIQVLMLFGMGLCGNTPPSQDQLTVDQQSIKSELEGRSFRQFHPARDADARKGVVLDFTGPIVLWAQYSEEGRAINEWEIRADDYRVSGDVEREVVIHLENPQFTQRFPVSCENCVNVEGVSISVRAVFDAEEIAFRINDPASQLPRPFPVFGGWTRFIEDERVD